MSSNEETQDCLPVSTAMTFCPSCGRRISAVRLYCDQCSGREAAERRRRMMNRAVWFVGFLIFCGGLAYVAKFFLNY